jgi:hypothetical protein
VLGTEACGIDDVNALTEQLCLLDPQTFCPEAVGAGGDGDE